MLVVCLVGVDIEGFLCIFRVFGILYDFWDGEIIDLLESFDVNL